MGMLLVSRSELVEENAVEVFQYYGVHFSSFLMQNLKSLIIITNSMDYVTRRFNAKFTRALQ